MKCDKCGLINPDPARFCNNCGAAAPPPAAPVKQTPDEWINKNWKPIALVLVVLIVLGIGGLLTDKRYIEPASSASHAPAPSPAAHWDSTDAKIEAFVMSERFVKKRLKAPASADFPSYSDHDVNVYHAGGGVFVVDALWTLKTLLGRSSGHVTVVS